MCAATVWAHARVYACVHVRLRVCAGMFFEVTYVWASIGTHPTNQTQRRNHFWALTVAPSKNKAVKLALHEAAISAQGRKIKLSFFETVIVRSARTRVLDDAVLAARPYRSANCVSPFSPNF